MLTLEQMRADIAATLHEDAEAVRDDDNLIDLGVDSMRALNLLTLWSEKGINLDFGDLAERVTLGEWWELVQQRQGRTGA